MFGCSKTQAKRILDEVGTMLERRESLQAACRAEIQNQLERSWNENEDVKMMVSYAKPLLMRLIEIGPEENYENLKSLVPSIKSLYRDLINKDKVVRSKAKIERLRKKWQGMAEAVIQDFNQVMCKDYSIDCDETFKLIAKQFESGYDLSDFRKVHRVKKHHWLNTKYKHCLRPRTLYGKRFSDYRNDEWDKYAKFESEPKKVVNYDNGFDELLAEGHEE